MLQISAFLHFALSVLAFVSLASTSADSDVLITAKVLRYVFTCPCDGTIPTSLTTIYPVLSNNYDWHGWNNKATSTLVITPESLIKSGSSDISSPKSTSLTAMPSALTSLSLNTSNIDGQTFSPSSTLIDGSSTTLPAYDPQYNTTSQISPTLSMTSTTTTHPSTSTTTNSKADGTVPSVGEPFSLQIQTSDKAGKRSILSIGYVGGLLVLVTDNAVAFVITSQGILMIYGTQLVVGYAAGQGVSALVIYPSVSAMPAPVVFSFLGSALSPSGGGFCSGATGALSVNNGAVADASCSPVDLYPNKSPDSYNTAVASSITPWSPATTTTSTQHTTSIPTGYAASTSLLAEPSTTTNNGSATVTLTTSPSSIITTEVSTTTTTSQTTCQVNSYSTFNAPSGARYSQFWNGCGAAIPTSAGTSYQVYQPGPNTNLGSLIQGCLGMAEKYKATVWDVYQYFGGAYGCGFWSGISSSTPDLVQKDGTVIYMYAFGLMGAAGVSTTLGTTTSPSMQSGVTSASALPLTSTSTTTNSNTASIISASTPSSSPSNVSNCTGLCTLYPQITSNISYTRVRATCGESNLDYQYSTYTAIPGSTGECDVIATCAKFAAENGGSAFRVFFSNWDGQWHCDPGLSPYTSNVWTPRTDVGNLYMYNLWSPAQSNVSTTTSPSSVATETVSIPPSTTSSVPTSITTHETRCYGTCNTGTGTQVSSGARQFIKVMETCGMINTHWKYFTPSSFPNSLNDCAAIEQCAKLTDALNYVAFRVSYRNSSWQCDLGSVNDDLLVLTTDTTFDKVYSYNNVAIGAGAGNTTIATTMTTTSVVSIFNSPSSILSSSDPGTVAATTTSPSSITSMATSAQSSPTTASTTTVDPLAPKVCGDGTCLSASSVTYKSRHWTQIMSSCNVLNQNWQPDSVIGIDGSLADCDAISNCAAEAYRLNKLAFRLYYLPHVWVPGWQCGVGAANDDTRTFLNNTDVGQIYMFNGFPKDLLTTTTSSPFWQPSSTVSTSTGTNATFASTTTSGISVYSTLAAPTAS